MDFLDKVQMDDLEGEQHELAELIGLENFKSLIRVYSGAPLYIPKADGVGRCARNEAIRKEFDGINYRFLSQKYQLTEVTIRSIVADLAREYRCKQIDGQVKLDI